MPATSDSTLDLDPPVWLCNKRITAGSGKACASYFQWYFESGLPVWAHNKYIMAAVICKITAGLKILCQLFLTSSSDPDSHVWAIISTYWRCDLQNLRWLWKLVSAILTVLQIQNHQFRSVISTYWPLWVKRLQLALKSLCQQLLHFSYFWQYFGSGFTCLGRE